MLYNNVRKGENMFDIFLDYSTKSADYSSSAPHDQNNKTLYWNKNAEVFDVGGIYVLRSILKGSGKVKYQAISILSGKSWNGKPKSFRKATKGLEKLPRKCKLTIELDRTK